jgi:hypothetical protein
MKKLLLSLASLALISTSLYAGCTADVDMGNTNKIINLEAGSNDGDAVTYAQSLKRVVYDVPEDNPSLLASLSADYNVIVERIGNVCILQGLLKNASATDITTTTQFGTVSAGYRPLQLTYGPAHHKAGSVSRVKVFIKTDGSVGINAYATAPLKSTEWVSTNISYYCKGS